MARSISDQIGEPIGFPPDLLIGIDRSAPQSLRQQIEQQLREAIHHGQLRVGVELPPTRALAEQLGISRNVVVGAYRQLGSEGYLEARQGSGTKVRATPRAPADEPAPLETALPSFRFDFGVGLPDPTLFPILQWQRAQREALAVAMPARLGHPIPAGTSELRSAVAGYLGRVRGVRATPHRVVITNGFWQGLTLLARVLLSRGAKRVAIEDPCLSLHRLLLGQAGLETVPIEVDDQGMRVDLLEDSAADAVLVTPAHQFPFGSVLSAVRRAQLIDWARREGAFVVEDDYDAEYRYDGIPVGALQGLDPERVIYGGSTSKVLTPALRVGWMVMPAELVDQLALEKFFDDQSASVLEQLALARLFDRGDLTRHLRRTRPVYRRRRDALGAALVQHLAQGRVRGISGGLHLLVEMPHGFDEAAAVLAAREAGVAIEACGPHYAAGAGPSALVLGYGAIGEGKIEPGVRALAAALRPLLA